MKTRLAFQHKINQPKKKIVFVHIFTIYISRGYFPGQELAPSPLRRVASGLQSLISRHFFINQSL